MNPERSHLLTYQRAHVGCLAGIGARMSCRPGCVVFQGEDPRTDTWKLLPLGPSVHRPVKGARGDSHCVQSLPSRTPRICWQPFGEGQLQARMSI